MAVTGNQATDTGVHVTRRPDIDDVVVQQPVGAPYVAVRDQARWGPIWAGLLTALSVFLVIQSFLYWIGAEGLHYSASGNVVATGQNTWISAVVGGFCFFVGGWMAARSIGDRVDISGTLNGFCVWALGVVAIVIMAGLGSGLAFGPVGVHFGSMLFFGKTAGQASAMAASGGTIVEAGTAGWILLFLICSAILACIGGYIGAPDNRYVERMTTGTTNSTM